ncbi:MAG: cytochrome c-type biogenesis protein [Pseudomonadota bacterium]
MMRGLVAAVLLYLSGLAWAQAQTSVEPSEESMESVAVDARTEAISKTLRCVVCQNQSIYDSNAPLAEDMRRLVRKRVLAGDTDDQAREYLRSRYGDYVLMTPPFQLNTILLWLGPLVLFLVGSIWFAQRLRRDRTDVPADISDIDRARIAEALAETDRVS